MHEGVGPTYCETAQHGLFFIAEPINTVTNVAIILAAFLAFRYVRKHARGSTPADTLGLIVLLALTGVGSFLWHALRTEWALSMDVFPGLFFLLVFIYAWTRRLYGVAFGAGAVAAFIGMTWALSVLSQYFNWPFLFPLFGGALALGLVFVWLTRRVCGTSVAQLALWMLMTALAAAFFRTIDMSTCDVVSFGTHWLWHVLLSTAAFMAIVLLVRIRAARSQV